MSSASQYPEPTKTQAAPEIETIYTTVESQPDQTDWLTVVSNLRQINRQLVEEIARLEQALASSTQSLHTYKEEKQSHEITILQQQDELKGSHDRVGALFQQLETSHQIGQRQQVLIETLSQQLEITQAIVPQLETEHNELRQQYQAQSQKLAKTEQVALELHRRLKQQVATMAKTSDPATATEQIPAVVVTSTDLDHPGIETATTSDLPGEEIEPSSDLVVMATQTTDLEAVSMPATPAEDRSIEPEDPVPTWHPTPPSLPREEIPAWTPVVNSTWQTTTSNSKSSDQDSWRETIANSSPKIAYNLAPEISLATPTAIPTHLAPAEVVNKESTIVDPEAVDAKPGPNWPAPTLNRAKSVAPKKVEIDLPRFPKKK